MKPNNTCPFCHLSVAPFDPSRLERNGQAAHEGCVKGKSQPGVYAACVRFLAERGADFEASAFKIKAKSATSPKALAKVVAMVLSPLVVGSSSAKAAAEVTLFASQMADRLFVDINVGDAPAPKPNGATKSSSF